MCNVALCLPHPPPADCSEGSLWATALCWFCVQLWRTASRGRRAVRHWRAFISAKIEWEARAALQVRALGGVTRLGRSG